VSVRRCVVGRWSFVVARRCLQVMVLSRVSQSAAAAAAAAEAGDGWLRGCYATSCLSTWMVVAWCSVWVASQHTDHQMNCARRRRAVMMTMNHAGLPARSVALSHFTRHTVNKRSLYLNSKPSTAATVTAFSLFQWQQWQICVYFSRWEGYLSTFVYLSVCLYWFVSSVIQKVLDYFKKFSCVCAFV